MNFDGLFQRIEMLRDAVGLAARSTEQQAALLSVARSFLNDVGKELDAMMNTYEPEDDE